LNFCARCASPLVPAAENGHPALVCANPACGRVTYRNAKPCAGVLLEHDGRVLLVQRAIDPFKGRWDIPGGFLQEWEHPAEAALREVREETGLVAELLALLGIFVDTYGDRAYATLNIYFRARLVGGQPRAADDAHALGWFESDRLPGEIAFPDHEGEVLSAWREAFARDPHPAPQENIRVHVSPAARVQFGVRR
jgi:8-oxo-dGTP diphosphatase